MTVRAASVAVVLAMAITAGKATSTPTCCGDLNGDGLISTGEATKAIVALLGGDATYPDLQCVAGCGPPGSGVQCAIRVVLNLVNRTCN